MSTNSTNTSGDITIGGDAAATNLIGRDQINLHIQNVVLQIAQTLPTTQDTPTAEWQACAERYRDGIYHTCNRIRLLGQQETKPLDAMYTDVYLLPERIARRRYAIDLNEHFKRDFAEYARASESKRLPAHSLLNQPDSQRLFILGKPGAGKTTFLRHVAMQAARGELDKLPIFITLRDWSDGTLNLLDYIIQQFEIHGFPRARAFVSAMLGLGRALVLFDGLDEVNIQNKKRETVIREIKDFCQQYRPTQCLLTCRNAAEDYTFEGFRYVEVADFTHAQVKTFASHWFAPNQADTAAFLTALAHKDHKGIRDLCKTPLLLTLVCLTFEETRTFPPRRAELYQQALDGLLVKWDSSRGIKRDDLYGRLSLGRKTQLLARLAHDAFQRHEIFFKLPWLARQTEQNLTALPPSELGITEINGSGVIKMIEAQHGLLVERAHEIYSFSHLNLQEYFSAQYLHSHQDKLASLFTPERILDDRWREVFLLTASLWDEAEVFFEAFAIILKAIANEWNKYPALQSIAKTTSNQTNGTKKILLRFFYIKMYISYARSSSFTLPFAHVLTLAHSLAY